MTNELGQHPTLQNRNCKMSGKMRLFLCFKQFKFWRWKILKPFNAPFVDSRLRLRWTRASRGNGSRPTAKFAVARWKLPLNAKMAKSRAWTFREIKISKFLLQR